MLHEMGDRDRRRPRALSSACARRAQEVLGRPLGPPHARGRARSTGRRARPRRASGRLRLAPRSSTCRARSRQVVVGGRRAAARRGPSACAGPGRRPGRGRPARARGRCRAGRRPRLEWSTAAVTAGRSEATTASPRGEQVEQAARAEVGGRVAARQGTRPMSARGQQRRELVVGARPGGCSAPAARQPCRRPCPSPATTSRGARDAEPLRRPRRTVSMPCHDSTRARPAPRPGGRRRGSAACANRPEHGRGRDAPRRPARPCAHRPSVAQRRADGEPRRRRRGWLRRRARQGRVAARADTARRARGSRDGADAARRARGARGPPSTPNRLQPLAGGR